MAFPETIRAARAAKGLNQSEVAHSLGVSQVTVSGWERGAYVPTVPVLNALATLLGLDHGDLLRLAAGGSAPIEASA